VSRLADPWLILGTGAPYSGTPDPIIFIGYSSSSLPILENTYGRQQMQFFSAFSSPFLIIVSFILFHLLLVSVSYSPDVSAGENVTDS
jgi:hypothetical protein